VKKASWRRLREKARAYRTESAAGSGRGHAALDSPLVLDVALALAAQERRAVRLQRGGDRRREDVSVPILQRRSGEQLKYSAWDLMGGVAPATAARTWTSGENADASDTARKAWRNACRPSSPRLRSRSTSVRLSSSSTWKGRGCGLMRVRPRPHPHNTAEPALTRTWERKPGRPAAAGRVAAAAAVELPCRDSACHRAASSPRPAEAAALSPRCTAPCAATAARPDPDATSSIQSPGFTRAPACSARRHRWCAAWSSAPAALRT